MSQDIFVSTFNQLNLMPSTTDSIGLVLGGLPGSLAQLKEEAHANRLAIQQQLVEGKGTEKAYRRHLKNYHAFWSGFQDRKVGENV